MAPLEHNEEGHSGTEKQRGKRNGHEKKAALSGDKRHLGEVVRLARELPRRAQEGMRDRPQTTLAAVAGASFVLGTLLGTRVIRAALYAAVPYVAVQIMKGELGERVLSYASELMRDPEAQDRSRMDH
jgi:ElaB/YqjD/DUF883 family membrane-anchored ribosome-binding protein